MAVVAMGRYGGFELSYGSDADVMFVHEPVPGADPHAASTYAQAVANELRRLLALPDDRPAARGRRRPAARGQAGPAGAHPRLLRRLLREVVEGLGVPGAAARRRRRRRRGAAAAVHRADRPAALPGRGHHRRRRGRGTADQGARRPRAAAARCRPQHPPQAGPRRAGRHRVDRAAAADAARGRRCRGCARRGPSTRWPRPREAGLLSAEDADVLVRSWRMVSRVRNAVTLVQGKGSDQLPRDPRDEDRDGRRPRLPARGQRRDGQRLPPDHPPRPSAVVDRVFWG